MKILLVLGRYLPEKSGGIENYTHFLANILLKYNRVVNVAILNTEESGQYLYESVRIIPLNKGFESFCALLKSEQYDICHFHELSAFGGIELLWFREAKENCKKVFFTFHLPYLTCYKNDFRYRGIEDCNQFNSMERCVECIIATKLKYKKGINSNWHNSAIALVMPLLKRTNKIEKLRKAINTKKSELQQLIEVCDSIFIYGKWFKKLLNDNGYHSPKFELIPHISKPDFERKEQTCRIKYKLIFAGRIEKAKGLHLLVKAMNIISTNKLQLDVVGNIVDEKYFDDCKEIYPFNYKGVVPRKNLLHSFPDYDFLVLPSVFTEMFSLVLKEAFYEHLPVIVSTAKGNKDVVKEGINGFLFDYDSAKDLGKTIDKAYQLKEKGWKPEFSPVENSGKDIEEIISYYK